MMIDIFVNSLEETNTESAGRGPMDGSLYYPEDFLHGNSRLPETAAATRVMSPVIPLGAVRHKRDDSYIKALAYTG
jgi:hypothetical protein